MADFFALIYENWFGLYNSQYPLIFDTLYNEGGYVWFGLSFIFIPLILCIFFYLFWKYPYAKFRHWIMLVIGTAIIVGLATYGFAFNEILSTSNPNLVDALNDPESGYEKYASTLPLKYALINSLLSVVIQFFYSLILKQFSKVNIHLPF